MNDAEEIVSMLIDEARGQIALQFSNADSHDTKALALLGADLAAGIAIISLHAVQSASTPLTIFDRYWWIPVVGTAASALAFCFTLWNRAFKAGPAPDDFYANHISQTSRDAKYALLTDLSIAIRGNGERLGPKAAGWMVGAFGMIGTAVAWIVLWAVVN
jgi:hypothetical protein